MHGRQIEYAEWICILRAVLRIAKIRRQGTTRRTNIHYPLAMEIPKTLSSNALKTRLSSSLTFSSLGVQPDLVAALTAMSITSPSEIQQKAIPDILAGERPPQVFPCDLTLWKEKQLTDIIPPSLWIGFKENRS
jgi:hypothetical protein